MSKKPESDSLFHHIRHSDKQYDYQPCQAERIITYNPFAGYEPERPQREPKFLTRKEIDKIMTKKTVLT